MAVDFAVREEKTFPAGTTVKAYPRSNWGQGKLPPVGAPPGAAAAEAVVAATGVALLSGLAAGTQYFAGGLVGGQWRYLAFETDPGAVEVDVQEDFGAKGDGVTDDAAALNAAIAAVAAKGGGVVSLPPGTYLVKSTINLKSNVWIESQGAAIKPAPPLVTAVLQAAAGDLVEDVQLQGFEIEGNSGAFAANVIGINLLKAKRVRIKGVFVRNTYHIGILANECTDLTVDNNYLAECGRKSNSPNAIHVLKGVRARVEANNITDWGNAGTGRAIYVAQTVGAQVIGNNVSNPGSVDNSHMVSVESSDRAQIVDNMLDSSAYLGVARKCMGISVFNSNDCLVASNRILMPSQDNGSLECIQVDGTSARCTVTGNHCDRGDDNGITAWGAGEHVVTGNYVQYAAHHGISCFGKDCTVTGNIVKNSGQHPVEGLTPSGIGILSVSGCVVTGNRCFDDQAEKTQNYGIFETGTGNENTFLGNDLRGNKQGAISYVGTGTIVGANMGQAARKGEVEVHNIGAQAFSDANAGGVAPPLGTLLFREDAAQVAVRSEANQYTPLAKDRTSTLTDAAALSPSFKSGNHFIITATAGVGANRTINNPSFRVQGATITFDITNSTGGAIATTWNAAFKLAGAWVDPANGKTRTITFYCYDGTNWRELGRSQADI